MGVILDWLEHKTANYKYLKTYCLTRQLHALRWELYLWLQADPLNLLKVQYLSILLCKENVKVPILLYFFVKHMTLPSSVESCITCQCRSDVKVTWFLIHFLALKDYWSFMHQGLENYRTVGYCLIDKAIFSEMILYFYTSASFERLQCHIKLI